MKPQTLAFTGHRPESLPFGENELDPACVRIKAMMLDEIMNCAANNFCTFIQGGAYGGDLIFAEQVLLVKAAEHPNIRLVTVVPHEGQANSWTESWRERYFRVLELSSEVITLSSHYTSGCYHTRNRYLVDHCDKLLALYDGGGKGGTAYTVQYARQKNKEIVVIDPIAVERRMIPPRLASAR